MESSLDYQGAEAMTRRGLEESVRLLDEQLGRATQRAEREALQRKEAERRAVSLTGELASLRSDASHAAHTRSAEDSDRLEREINGREVSRRLEAALADRAALEGTVTELQGEVEVMVQRLEAEARARSVLQESAALADRELVELRERVSQQRQACVELSDVQRTLELQLREAQHTAEDKASEVSDLSSALQEVRVTQASRPVVAHPRDRWGSLESAPPPVGRQPRSCNTCSAAMLQSSKHGKGCRQRSSCEQRRWVWGAIHHPSSPASPPARARQDGTVSPLSLSCHHTDPPPPKRPRPWPLAALGSAPLLPAARAHRRRAAAVRGRARSNCAELPQSASICHGGASGAR